MKSLPSVEPLESRVHLSYAPYSIGDALPGPRRYVVDVADRVNLRNHLAGSSIGTKLASLKSGSATFAAEFDKTLLDYMKARTAPNFDFSPADVPGIVSFIKGSADADQQKLYNARLSWANLARIAS